jgi:hypothetical protein
MKNSAIKLFTLLFVLSSLHLMAQRASPEFSIHAGGGISTLTFQPFVKGNSSVGFFSDIGGGFTGFFTHQIGIHVGAGLGMFSVKTNVKEVHSFTSGMYDHMEDKIYDLTATLLGYSEIHKSMFVNIPIMLQFQTKQKQYWNWRQSRKAGFYAMGGIKIHFLFNNKYESSVDSVRNLAYYTEYGGWAGTQLFKGFGTFPGNNTKNEGKLEFVVMATFSIETGVKWRIDKNAFLYTGVFLDCSLNDPNKLNRMPYENDPSAIQPNTDISSIQLLKVSNGSMLIFTGIKLRFAFTKPQRGY